MIPVGILTAAATSSFTFLLDLYPGASTAYSLRKLRSAYTGACFRVKRSSDNAQTDIGFVNNVLDTTTLLTFCGSSDGYVVTWYDQSGNNINISSISNPIAVLAGVLITTNGKPSIFFDDIDGYISPATSITCTNISLFSVIKINTTTKFVLYQFSGGINLTGESGSPAAADSFVILDRYINAVQNLTLTRALVYTNYNINLQLLSSQYFQITNISSFAIGRFPGFEVKGFIQEFVLYPNSQFSNNTPINNNINSFYTIY
jgi:hypothetical protein